MRFQRCCGCVLRKPRPAEIFCPWSAISTYPPCYLPQSDDRWLLKSVLFISPLWTSWGKTGAKKAKYGYNIGHEYRRFDIPVSKCRSFDISKYRNIEVLICRNFRNIERVLPFILWHSRVFNADTERKLRCVYQISKSYISTINTFFFIIDIVSNSIPIPISNTISNMYTPYTVVTRRCCWGILGLQYGIIPLVPELP